MGGRGGKLLVWVGGDLWGEEVGSCGWMRCGDEGGGRGENWTRCEPGDGSSWWMSLDAVGGGGGDFLVDEVEGLPF